MTNNQIPFTRLRNILHDLGFEETAIPGPYRFSSTPLPEPFLSTANTNRPTR